LPEQKIRYFATMKAKLIFVSLFLATLLACNDSGETKATKSENDMDAARNFLDAALKGNYREASHYMLQDSTNLGYLNVTERKYQTLEPGKKDSLSTASLRFYDTKRFNDSVTITVFANSYKNDKDTLKIVRLGGQWLVDLKYLFEHDMDTLFNNQPAKTDSIHK
jgi:hypothetical protein